MRPISCSRLRPFPQRLAFAGLTALALSLLPSAADADVRIYGQISGAPALAPGVAFAVHLGREDLALDYGPGDDQETLAMRRLGFTLSEAVGERIRVGVRLGRLWTSQSGRDATSGVDPRGHYLDLVFAAERPLGTRVRGTFDASWRYAVADATDDADRDVDLEWQAWTLRSGVRIPLRERVAARLGASVSAVDGDERVRGTDGSTTTDFEAAGNVSGYLALDFMPQPDDVVSFQLEGGEPRTGVFVSFEHRY